MTGAIRSLALAGLLWALAPRSAAGQEGGPAARAFGLGEVRLGVRPLAGLDALLGTPLGGTVPDQPAPAPPPPLVTGKTVAVFGGLVAIVPVIGYFTWWAPEEKVPWHMEPEGWFGRDTYTGGADKASHIVVSAIAEELLEGVFRKIGHTPAQARILSVAGVAVAGLAVEAGDGFTVYGAAWEDVAANVLGALASAGVGAAGLRDTVAFRLGIVKYMIPDPCCRATAYGADYSKWIHSVDVLMSGLLPRVGVKPGPARFLLVSLTYGTKGYRYSPPEVRERNVGLDIGLNLPEVLRAVGVPDDRWWGSALLSLFRYVRIPYTAYGFRYDLNHHKWSGWDTGDHFDPGSVIYD